MVTTRPPKTIVKPTALGPVANTDTKLLIYGLFQKGRVLAQDGVKVIPVIRKKEVAYPPDRLFAEHRPSRSTPQVALATRWGHQRHSRSCSP